MGLGYRAEGLGLGFRVVVFTGGGFFRDAQLSGLPWTTTTHFFIGSL